MAVLEPNIKSPRIMEVKERKPLDLRKYVKRSATTKDFSELIKENFIIQYKGKPLVVYLVLKDIPNYNKILNTLKHTHFSTNVRTTGLRTTSKIFGFSPRETIRKDYCSSTAFAREDPEGHYAICDFGKTLANLYRRYCPEMFEYHHAVSKMSIMDDRRIHGTPFTSGIINKNNPLKYHFDRGNIKNVYSNMIVFKQNCEGGYLAIPEFDVGLECSNKSVVFFDGQDILHGVTPFKLNNTKTASQSPAYRFSIVYYTLHQMWKCKEVSEELARITKRKTDRELRRYKRLTGELNPENDDLYKSLSPLAKKYREQSSKNKK